MTLRSKTKISVAKKLIAFLVLLVLCNPVRSEQINASASLGLLELPDFWIIDHVSSEEFIAWSPDSLSRVTLIKLDRIPYYEYLHTRADELNISRHVRSVSGKHCELAGAEKGGFIQGLVPENPEVAPVPAMEEWEGYDWENVSGIPSRYLLVSAYESGSSLLIMQGETIVPSGSTMLLSEIQRSWRLP